MEHPEFLEIIEPTKEFESRLNESFNILEDAKSIVKLPVPEIRISIFKNRIIEKEGKKYNHSGGLWHWNNRIYLSEKFIKWSNDYLREVLWHEFGHFFVNEHNENCLLMRESSYSNNAPTRDMLILPLLRTVKTRTRCYDFTMMREEEYYETNVSKVA